MSKLSINKKNKQYVKLNINSICGELIINISKHHIIELAHKIFEKKIIYIEYIDENIRLQNIKTRGQESTILITDEMRIKFIINILNKECIKGTSRIIAEMY